MGNLRRFLNLIVDNHESGVLSLRCLDLKRLQLFHPTTPLKTLLDDRERSESAVPESNTSSQNNKQAAGTASTMKSIRLPNPSISFEACSAHGRGNQWNVWCFPLTERKVIGTDQCGRNVLFDGDTHDVVVMPKLHKPKVSPISLFIPSDGGNGSLFIMERVPDAVRRCDIGKPSHDFEVLVYKDRMTCQLLPPPPYVHEPSYWDTRSKISSYAVVGGGSLICISVNDTGTYFLDTKRHTWSKVGNWMLPFHGKVEYVPELKLWFGLSADAHHLAAADLSTMDSQPQLVGGWKELYPPEDWVEYQNAQLVYLGSGKFCMARFFLTWVSDNFGFKLYDRNVAALTGVEVVPRALNGNANGRGNGGNGEVELEMITHKTRYHMPAFNQTIIKELF